MAVRVNSRNVLILVGKWEERVLVYAFRLSRISVLWTIFLRSCFRNLSDLPFLGLFFSFLFFSVESDRKVLSPEPSLDVSIFCSSLRRG